ncbi:hypothetical protein [Pedobacter gandavensis]|uniref:hypothetical protein n=1 Tax=Pedobacter gandavensis TaxID=2679963 RepID=UPI00292DECB2|nr:hypothetical protein [Pedobacter gandavensis]
MKMNVTINPTEDFSVLCDLFKVAPQALLQEFVNQVSFPFYYSQPDGDERWATLFFLYYLGKYGQDNEADMPMHEPFMNQMAEVVFKELENGHQNSKKAETAGRKVMKNWHKQIMEKRGA